jgi:uncharacterized NAD-dependent epimerase/dehydratase family protein
MRRFLGDFPMVAMPTVASEIALIEAFADTRVIGVTINHEHMAPHEIDASIGQHRLDLGLPVTDPLTRPLDELADMAFLAFPELVGRATASRC